MNTDNSAVHASPQLALFNRTLDPSSTDYTEFLLQCMQERGQIAADLKHLAEAQRDAASQGDVNVTLGFLSRKQVLLDNLATLQEKMQPYFHDDAEQRKWSSSDRRELCRQLSERGSQVLQETMHIENSTLADMSTRRDAIAAQLQDGKDSILARNAYGTESVLQESQLDIGDL